MHARQWRLQLRQARVEHGGQRKAIAVPLERDGLDPVRHYAVLAARHGAPRTPEDLAKRGVTETAKWAKAIRDAKIEPQ